MTRLLFFLFFTLPVFAAQRLKVDINAPVYKEGVLTTNHGAVITGEDFYLQGEHVTYVRTQQKHQVTAHGNLLLLYKGYFFVGEELEYDFQTEEGKVQNGKASDGLWILGSREIYLQKNSYFIHQGYMTLSETPQICWQITAQTIHLLPKSHVHAKKVRFRVKNVPLLALPSFKTTLNQPSSPIRYALAWESGLGPKLSMRYTLYSWKNFNVVGRLDYRIAKGAGIALETDYRKKNHNLITESYLARDVHPNARKRDTIQWHYRLHGKYDALLHEKTTLKASFDKLSDQTMPSHFPSPWFELRPMKPTKLSIDHTENQWRGNLTVHPKVNYFQGIKEELPSLSLNVKTLKSQSLPLFFQNSANFSYLYYDHAHAVQKVVPNFNAIRFRSEHRLFYPVHLKGCQLTLESRANVALYSNSPAQKSAEQALLQIGGHVESYLARTGPITHAIQPYGSYHTVASIRSTLPFIFDIYDAQSTFHRVQAGVKQTFSGATHAFGITSSVIGFFGATPFHTFIPKGQLNWTWTSPSFALSSQNQWNFNEQSLDHSNIELSWTFSANAAFAVAFLHRGPFDWRQSSPDSVVMQMTRSIDQLLDSPLSDNRNLALAKLQLRLTPTWIARLQTHIGWGRKQAPWYYEAKVDVLHQLTASWRLRFTGIRTQTDIRGAIGIEAIASP